METVKHQNVLIELKKDLKQVWSWDDMSFALLLLFIGFSFFILFGMLLYVFVTMILYVGMEEKRKQILDSMKYG